MNKIIEEFQKNLFNYICTAEGGYKDIHLELFKQGSLNNSLINHNGQSCFECQMYLDYSPSARVRELPKSYHLKLLCDSSKNVKNIICDNLFTSIIDLLPILKVEFFVFDAVSAAMWNRVMDPYLRLDSNICAQEVSFKRELFREKTVSSKMESKYRSVIKVCGTDMKKCMENSCIIVYVENLNWANSNQVYNLLELCEGYFLEDKQKFTRNSSKVFVTSIVMSRSCGFSLFTRFCASIPNLRFLTAKYVSANFSN